MTAVFLAPDPVSAIQRAEQRVQRAAARARKAARENEKSRAKCCIAKRFINYGPE